MNYDVVIGIETHIQLKTATKMFCRCSATFFGLAPNTHTCPVCLGLPGALPVINKVALEQAMLMGLALKSEVATEAHFDRKNYFYPDLAKGYQISQYDQPICIGGQVAVDGRQIGLIRAHIEEDVGKLNHHGSDSLIDFNKGGVPLLEIVSEPVMNSAVQAKAYVQQLRQIARYLGVNEGNLEQGTMRADINISLQEKGKWRYEQGEFVLADGYVMHKRAEIKNVNSFRSIERAVEYEIKRQTEVLDSGGEVAQETRGWDDPSGKTTSQRGKEEAHDYRYFPEPDLPPLVIDRAWVEEIKGRLPELPTTKKERFMRQYELNDYTAHLLTEEQSTADWFEQAVENTQAVFQNLKPDTKPASKVANWVLGELARLQNDQNITLSESKLLPGQLAAVLYMIDDGKLTVTTAKTIIAETFISGKDPLEMIKERSLEQVSGNDDLAPVAQKVIDQNPEAVAKYKAGKDSLIMFLVGQVMKETQGRANPAVAKELLEASLKT
jgi:aspartyl-tRNA(Asn)/glutamyl-tRNA(Gln) amidotransferase subunit B